MEGVSGLELVYSIDLLGGRVWPEGLAWSYCRGGAVEQLTAAAWWVVCGLRAPGADVETVH